MYVLQEFAEFFHSQGLWTVDDCDGGVGVEVYEDHVGAGNDALGGDVHYVEDVIGAAESAAY